MLPRAASSSATARLKITLLSATAEFRSLPFLRFFVIFLSSCPFRVLRPRRDAGSLGIARSIRKLRRNPIGCDAIKAAPGKLTEYFPLVHLVYSRKNGPSEMWAEKQLRSAISLTLLRPPEESQ